MTRRSLIMLTVLLVIAILVGVTGAGIGVYGLSLAGEASDKADTLLESRDTSRQIACDQFNEQQLRSRAGDDRQTRLHFEALNDFTGQGRTPEEEATVRAFLERLYADQAKASAKSYPLRDCTPAGIAAYYDDH